MNILFLFGLLVLNFGISAWNAYASGAYWTESKIVGGWPRVLTWSGVVMSACGFTWCYLTLLTMFAVSGKYLTLDQGQAMFELGYLVILLPLLGSGLAIWAQSVVQAYRERNFGSIARASWNTYAQFHNTWQAASQAPSALEHVLKAFTPKSKGGKNDGAALVLVVLLVILALAGGALTAASIVRWADRRVALDVVAA